MSRSQMSKLLKGCVFLMFIVICDFVISSFDTEVKKSTDDDNNHQPRNKDEKSTLRLPAGSFLDETTKIDFLTNEELLKEQDKGVLLDKSRFYEKNNGGNFGKFRNIARDGATDMNKYEIKQVKADCLPKLVCELAGLPAQALGVKERHLLDMIRNSGIGNMAEVASRWHFAVHMGQLMADTQGCAALWSGCPLAHGPLLELARRLTFKR